ncbi:Hypothetical protein RMHFA_04443 [Roseomonas mucosa]|uniref:Secreted protein n=1 Tax=Roseomonas mucosa TaxID=207340 RepID=A0A1S8D623_9PROT|nr:MULTISPECIES: cell envelope integrity EipB family protein [Roseomonas]ATR22548.1 DUF1849 domain-containing protein [Roseomonas sp. FDAARGOS_362]AWV24461.1 Hypothetical protein RADP37_04443 [Roseomonas mucosa]MDT8278354.1 cell envelope integrity EipB family protein [Roseomonas mucosa]MDT8354009.1 cell envelope integrity EipB family protein [Roseomonas mucosa]MDU7522819.1 cell envelope integrity EipB family protein [Roseomonas mucosa]
MRLRPVLRLAPLGALALLAAPCLLVALPAGAQAPKPPAAATAHLPGVQDMAAHRAAYRLTLEKTRENSDVAGVQGAMLFEVLDACDGWTTRQRLTLRILNRDGQQIDTASDYSTYESKDGHTLRFSMTQSSGGAVSQRVVGEATREADGSGTIRYEQPQASEARMPPGTLFPMMHTIKAIDTAVEGRRMMLAPLMDGTSEDGSQDSTTFILNWDGKPQEKPRFPLLANQGSGRMRIAFFGKPDGKDAGGAASPDYEVGLRYYANGVADDMKMDFGEFTLNGALEKLDPVPSRC